ncbi:Piwi-domain-containing protein [Westerdykella ornata]|uniref:Piwi-domain-containing protein n=1 Tax=Westerdykella ornata TaxID=318751 RepID=A0A6A6JQM0_WESOR|nr:Piwi-domain-containing protein [Westerdykella ornata]KAF2278534.1 Piwi-domain-containing protein [Westerdykella ornata]
MAGPAKARAQAEKKPSASSDSQPSGETGQRTTQRSIPRLDGNRDRLPGLHAVDYTKHTDLKNLSEFLGAGGWYTARGFEIPDSLPQRPKELNKYGRETAVALNTYNVIGAPTRIVHQYDISWSKSVDPTKRGLIKKLWNSKAVKSQLGEPQNLWIYDGNKLAWCSKLLDREETRITVDLDQEQGRSPKPDKSNVHTIYIKHTRKVDFAALQAFLDGRASWSTECIDTINFLDHVLRERPSQIYTQIKKSFFQKGEQRFDLGGGVEAFKGVFASLRPVLTGDLKKILSINVDVANGTFWRPQELLRAACQVFRCSSAPQFIQIVKDARRDWKNSYVRRDLARFNRVGVSDFHRKDTRNQWTIAEICQKDAHEATFIDPDDPEKKREISVYNYYKKKYGITLTSGIPVVKVTKKIRKNDVFLPMEYLKIDENQRYNTKLSDTQTSAMIKFAVTLPRDRMKAIEYGVRLLNWAQDPYLLHYGLKVSPTQSKVNARVLPSPAVGFGPISKPSTVEARDLVAGRWRLDGRKFIGPNTREIGAWGVCVIQGKFGASKEQTQAFVNNFIRIYEGHGGRFNTSNAAPGRQPKQPFISPGNLADGGELVAKAFNSTGNYFNSRPMLMVFIVNDRNAEVYRRIKKSCDCRFGVPSQILQSKHVISNSPQYISNVCMKVNAKLGGCTAIAKSVTIPKIAPQSVGKPTMVIGADVSHPAPGAGSNEKASFAAITVSADTTYTRYWAQCQTNGSRVEMVTTQNIKDHLGDMAKMWMQRVGQGRPPQRVLYIRDGVSEGQYAAVLEEEVRDMKNVFAAIGVQVPQFTVVIAGKRHHIRFFPQQGDRNGNPLPGTLVETGCTHPFEFDFYLCAHVAIKGTARPIHYQCILNEGKWEAAELQQFLFEHSYHYVRSTTPVSLHPAVYYAHLAADRSRAHQNESPVSSGKKEAKPPQTSSGSGKSVEVRPLLELNKQQGLKEVMWFV